MLALAVASSATPLFGPFSLALRPSYHLAWSIDADVTGLSMGILNVTMRTNTTGWLGLGLSPTSFLTFHGMNHADIVVGSWGGGSAETCSVVDMFNDRQG
jgi:hypothetical protein